MSHILKKNNFYLFIITAAVFLIYLNSLNNAFVSDDLPTIVNNPKINYFFHSTNPSDILNAVAYRLVEFKPPFYHLINIIIHGLASILVFFFLRLFFKPLPSFWGALIFAVHPVHSEAVTWISGRPYSLMTVFLLASFLSYIKATRQKFQPLALLSALLFYFLALWTNPFAFLFPAVIFLFDLLFGNRWQKNWKFWLFFLALAAVKAGWVLGATKERLENLSAANLASGWSNPFFNFVYSFFSGLWLFLWPINLTLYHEPNSISKGGLTAEIILISALFIFLPWIYKKAKIIVFALGIFIIFLTFTFSPVMISWLVAERYLYFPSLAFSILIAFWATKLNQRKKVFVWFNIFLSFLVIAYSIRTMARNSDWHDHITIWEATVAASPSSPKAHNNMGDVYTLKKDVWSAIEEFKTAIKLKPDYAEAYHNLANVYQQIGKADEAIALYQKAIYFNPSLYQSYQNLGIIYLQKGENESAKKNLKKALELNPDNQELEKILKTLES